MVPENFLATGQTVYGVNTGFGKDLGFSGNPDAIYRNVTLSFTPSSANATLRFGDDGLEEPLMRSSLPMISSSSISSTSSESSGSSSSAYRS